MNSLFSEFIFSFARQLRKTLWHFLHSIGLFDIQQASLHLYFNILRTFIAFSTGTFMEHSGHFFFVK